MFTAFDAVPMLDSALDDVMGSALGYATKPALFTPPNWCTCSANGRPQRFFT
jgi:hypothetical protein